MPEIEYLGPLEDEGKIEYLGPLEQDPKERSLLGKAKDYAEELIVGPVEAAGALATGVVAFPFARGAKMIALARGRSESEAEAEEGRVSESMTFKPKTRFGQRLTEMAGRVVSVPAEIGREALALPAESMGLEGLPKEVALTGGELAAYAGVGKGISRAKKGVRAVKENIRQMEKAGTGTEAAPIEDYVAPPETAIGRKGLEETVRDTYAKKQNRYIDSAFGTEVKEPVVPEPVREFSEKAGGRYLDSAFEQEIKVPEFAEKPPDVLPDGLVANPEMVDTLRKAQEFQRLPSLEDERMAQPMYSGIVKPVTERLEDINPVLASRADEYLAGGFRGKIEIVKPEVLEALVKGGRIGDLPKYAKGSSINLERLDTTQDVLQFQNALSSSAAKEIGKRKISWDETTKAAADLAWDEKEFLKQAKKKGGFDSAEIHAMRQVNVNALHDLFKTVQEMPADTALRTDAMRAGVLDKINNYVEIMKATSQKSSEAGRALNIHKKMVAENPEFKQDAYRRQVFQQMMDNLGGREMSDSMLTDLKNLDFSDPRKVRAIIQKYHVSGVFDKFYEAWLNAILSAPTSHAANILGNTLSIMTKIPESAVYKGLQGKAPFREVQAEAVGLWQGMQDGIRASLKAFRDGVPADMLTKLEHHRYNAIPGKFGEFVRIPTRALTAADEFFKSIVYRSELTRQASEIASNEGLSGRELGTRMGKIMNDWTDADFRNVHDKAAQESVYRTFNKPLGESGAALMRFRDKYPGVRYVLPFLRTPVNIAKFALERTPLNVPKILNDYRRGRITADEMKQEMAKPIVGSMISAAVVMAYLEGNITGAPPKLKADRDLKYAGGWQPYSIKIGNTYYSYNRLEPVGSLMGMTADFVEASQDDTEINEKAGKLILSFSRNIASKTFLQGISGVLDAMSDPERYGGNFVEKMAGSLIPTGIAAVARATDPYIREVETPFEAMQARIPIASKSLPYKEGAYGMPVERPGGVIQKLFSPVTVSEEKPGIKDLAEADLFERKINRKYRKMEKQTLREVSRQARIGGQ